MITLRVTTMNSIDLQYILDAQDATLSVCGGLGIFWLDTEGIPHVVGTMNSEGEIPLTDVILPIATSERMCR